MATSTRRWGQFSLRTLLALTLVSAGFLAWMAAERTRAAEQRAAWHLIATRGGLTNFGPEPSRSPWLCWLLGADVAAKGGCVEFAHSGLTDDDLATLTALRRINRLSLSQNPIADHGVAHLSKLSHLRNLSLDDTRITDAALDSLRSCQSLEYLSLFGTRTTPAGIERLREALPNLVVTDTNGDELPALNEKR